MVPPPPPPPPPPPLPDPAPPEPEEEILGSDDEEQEDPADYCKGDVLAFPPGPPHGLLGVRTKGVNDADYLIFIKLAS